MANETTMILITSNNDLIQQFQSNQTSNTFNFAFLSHLLDSNRTNDRICKRSLDSSSIEQTKSYKKPSEIICAICGNRAIGYNYDVLSCASCKAFFYRNINRTSDKIFCLTGQNNCPVSYEIRRKCTKCRLERCLTMGMRKDFLLNEQQKQIRFKNYFAKKSSTCQILNIESIENQMNQFLIEIENFERLNENDWLLIDNIRKYYLTIFEQEDSIDYSTLNVFDQRSALIVWSQIGNLTILKVINFVRQIEQFNQLNNNDRFILIKYNLLSLFSITKSTKFDLKYRDFNYEIEKTTIDIRKRIQFYALCFQTDGLRDSFLNLVCSLTQITEQDPIILSFLLLIILFSQGISMNENQPFLHQSLDVYRAQSYYVEILHKYLINKQGQTKTYHQFIQILNGIFQIQLLTKKFLDFFHFHYITNETVDKIAPLMQSILHIS